MQVGMTKDQGLYNKPSAAVHPGALAAGTLPQYNTIHAGTSLLGYHAVSIDNSVPILEVSSFPHLQGPRDQTSLDPEKEGRKIVCNVSNCSRIDTASYTRGFISLSTRL